MICKTLYYFGFRALPIFSSIFFNKNSENLINIDYEISTKFFGKILGIGQIFIENSKKITSLIKITTSTEISIIEKCEYLDDNTKITIKYYIEFNNQKFSIEQSYNYNHSFSPYYYWQLVINNTQLEKLHNTLKKTIQILNSNN